MRCRTRPAALLVALALALGACGDGAADVPEPRPSPLGPSAVPTAPPGFDAEGAPPLTLYISNQSFDDPEVAITVTIDGRPVADRVFPVEDQHTWVPYGLRLGPGEHTLVARADTGDEVRRTFELAADAPRWAVLQFWGAGEAPALRLELFDEPVGFA